MPLSPRKESLLNSRTPSPEKSNSNSPTVKTNPFMALLVRLPKIGVDLAPKKQPSALGFTIYEDTPEDVMKYQTLSPDHTNENTDDKENILQPKKMPSKQSSYQNRRPLGNLNVDDFPGYISAAGSIRKGPVRLRELYHSRTFNNESKTLHKYNRLPSYITPPRNLLHKILYCGGTEEDDIERRLNLKLRELARRRRLMSVGFNKGKTHLITKNQFKISM